MSERFELVGVYGGVLDLQRFAADKAEAEREAREIRELYRERGKGWAVYLVEHECDRDDECSCIDLHAPRFSSDALRLAREAGLCP
jgi:hypothetical protein